MSLLNSLWTWIFGRSLAPETPVELYFLGVQTIQKRKTSELTFVKGATWSEFTNLKHLLPQGEFGVGNPVVIVHVYELPGEKKSVYLYTKNDFEKIRNQHKGQQEAK